MSSDFFVKKSDLEEIGTLFYEDAGEFSGLVSWFANFPNYEYGREVDFSEDGTVVHVSCGGDFRDWFKREILEKHGISYEQF